MTLWRISWGSNCIACEQRREGGRVLTTLRRADIGGEHAGLAGQQHTSKHLRKRNPHNVKLRSLKDRTVVLDVLEKTSAEVHVQLLKEAAESSS